MKSYKLLLLIAFLSINSTKIYSQPVITSDVMAFDYYSPMIYHGKVVTDFDPGPAGMDVSWDFSTYIGDLNIQISPTSPSHCGNLSSYTENYIGDLDWWGDRSAHTSERSILRDSTAFSFCEIGGFEFLMTFDDLYTPLIFPITFGTENYSEFTGTCGSYGNDDPFSGNVSMVADAYGTLKLYSGNFEDVLRVKVIDNIGCGYGLIETYWWFKEGITGPLFKYCTDVDQDHENIFVHYEALGYLSINTEDANQAIIYPNPAADQLTIKADNIQSIELYDLKGSLIQSLGITGNEILFPIAKLEKGLYIIKITTTDNIMSSTFEKL